MDDLISRAYLLDIAEKQNNLLDGGDVRSAPSVEAVLVVHGHWIEKELFIPWCDDDVDIIYECSRCETESGGTSPHCPNCGAKMDEEVEDATD